jgi:catechol-2,3-dioxygenase
MLALPFVSSAQSGGGENLASLQTQSAMNVFRRFSVERDKVKEFYGDVLGLAPMPDINMPGGGVMTRYHVGDAEIKLTTASANQRGPSGPITDVTGLRVFTFFVPDEAAVTARFKARGYTEPAFRKAKDGKSGVAMVQDPDGQWVELVAAPGAPADTFSRVEVGLTVSDIDKSRAFYRDFVGLEELAPNEARSVPARQHRYRYGTITINLWSFGAGKPANTTTAGIQYVIRNIEAVDAKAKAFDVRVTQPLGPFGTALRTIWLADPDGVTNYFAQITRNAQ